MYIIPIAWSYVAVMIAATEESLFRGLIALLLWGVLPVGLFLYFAGSGKRRRQRAANEASKAELDQAAKSESPADHQSVQGDGSESDKKNSGPG
jgi:hypothetical protein